MGNIFFNDSGKFIADTLKNLLGRERQSAKVSQDTIDDTAISVSNTIEKFFKGLSGDKVNIVAVTNIITQNYYNNVVSNAVQNGSENRIARNEEKKERKKDLEAAINTAASTAASRIFAGSAAPNVAPQDKKIGLTNTPAALFTDVRNIIGDIKNSFVGGLFNKGKKDADGNRIKGSGLIDKFENSFLKAGSAIASKSIKFAGSLSFSEKHKEFEQIVKDSQFQQLKTKLAIDKINKQVEGGSMKRADADKLIAEKEASLANYQSGKVAKLSDTQRLMYDAAVEGYGYDVVSKKNWDEIQELPKHIALDLDLQKNKKSLESTSDKKSKESISDKKSLEIISDKKSLESISDTIKVDPVTAELDKQYKFKMINAVTGIYNFLAKGKLSKLFGNDGNDGDDSSSGGIEGLLGALTSALMLKGLTGKKDKKGKKGKKGKNKKRLTAKQKALKAKVKAGGWKSLAATGTAAAIAAGALYLSEDEDIEEEDEVIEEDDEEYETTFTEDALINTASVSGDIMLATTAGGLALKGAQKVAPNLTAKATGAVASKVAANAAVKTGVKTAGTVIKAVPIVGTVAGFGIDGYYGADQSEEWLGSNDSRAKTISAVGSMAGGSGPGIGQGSAGEVGMNIASTALTYGFAGAAIGSFIPIIGTAIGGAIGAGIGAITGAIGGQRIASALDKITPDIHDIAETSEVTAEAAKATEAVKPALKENYTYVPGFGLVSNDVIAQNKGLVSDDEILKWQAKNFSPDEGYVAGDSLVPIAKEIIKSNADIQINKSIEEANKKLEEEKAQQERDNNLVKSINNLAEAQKTQQVIGAVAMQPQAPAPVPAMNSGSFAIP